MSAPEFYSHSGRSGALGVPVASLFGLITAAVLGVVYTYAIVYIPFIYINFFLTAGFGFFVGFAVYYGGSVGKIRNNMICSAVALLCSGVGLYVAWAFDPLARIGAEEGIVAWDFNLLLGWMQWGYEEGFWGLTSGSNVSGIPLAIIWVIEAVMIVGIGTLTTFAMSADNPFCEDCNAWTQSEDNVATLWPHGEELSFEGLLQGDLALLDQLVRVSSSDYPHLALNLATCGTCQESNYLTIQMKQRTVNDKGEESISSDDLILNLRITHDDLDGIRNAGRELTEEELAAINEQNQSVEDAMAEADQSDEDE